MRALDRSGGAPVVREWGLRPAVTPEEAWTASRELAQVEPLDLDVELPGARVCVVAAHPDDDVLAIGSLLQRLDRDVELTFVRATDGEHSHPGSPTLRPDQMAWLRRAEAVNALRALETRVLGIERLGLPDSGLHEHEEDLRTALRPVLADADLVLYPWREDGHPDHEAVGRAAAALLQPGQAGWEYPVWAWRWAHPAAGDLPWDRARAYRASHRERTRKARAIRCFETQIVHLSPDPADRPVLDESFLAHFEREREVVLV